MSINEITTAPKSVTIAFSFDVNLTSQQATYAQGTTQHADSRVNDSPSGRWRFCLPKQAHETFDGDVTVSLYQKHPEDEPMASWPKVDFAAFRPGLNRSKDVKAG